ncbi:MAG: hypothetical protein IH840_14275 [Candidatus Heimdallarchaeota archaeon]|nr:hypothetical protein [Candidatus Heimdallarchaeota archaeon]
MSKGLKYRFKLLRVLGFQILDPKHGNRIIHHQFQLDDKLICKLLSKYGLQRFILLGGYIPEEQLNNFQILSLASDRKKQQIMNYFKSSKSPIEIAMKFAITILKNHNIKFKSDTLRITNKNFAILSTHLSKLQAQIGGLRFRENRQYRVSFAWIYKFQISWLNTNTKNLILNDVYKITTKLLDETLWISSI